MIRIALALGLLAGPAAAAEATGPMGLTSLEWAFTEALALRDEARRMGFQVMVGCMVGSSLAMAPAVLAAQGAAVVDLDGPLLLAEDRAAPLRYDEAGVHPPERELWG